MTNKSYSPQDRFYEFFTRFYCRRQQLEEFLRTRSDVGSLKHFAFICHDKDLKSDGNPTKEHFHVLLKFNNNKTCSSIIKDFKSCRYLQEDGNPSVIDYCEPIFNRLGSVDYLTHKNAPEKYQYSHDDVTFSSSEAEHFFRENVHNGSTNEDITADILDEALESFNPQNLTKKYGKEFLYHISCYKTAVDIHGGKYFTSTEFELMQSQQRQLEKKLDFYINLFNTLDDLGYRDIVNIGIEQMAQIETRKEEKIYE